MYIRDKKHFDSCFPQIRNAILSLIAQNKSVDVEVKEHKHRRTIEQNNYYWLFNKELADFLNDSGCRYGEYNLPYNKDLVHMINKQVFGVETTTKMSITEFGDYITRLFVFWGERTNNCFEMSETPAAYLEKRGILWNMCVPRVRSASRRSTIS